MGIVVIPIVLLMVVVSVESNLLDAPLFSWRTLGVFGLTLSTGLATALVLSHILIRPLKQTARLMEQLQQGDYSARVQVWANDEVGGIQHAFNEMVASLQFSHDALVRRNLELRALNELAENMSIDRGAESVLEKVLDSAFALLGADGGGIRLFDSQEILSRKRVESSTLLPNLDRLIREEMAELLAEVRTSGGNIGHDSNPSVPLRIPSNSHSP